MRDFTLLKEDVGLRQSRDSAVVQARDQYARSQITQALNNCRGSNRESGSHLIQPRLLLLGQPLICKSSLKIGSQSLDVHFADRARK